MPSPRGHRRPAMLAALLTHAALSFSQQGINLLMLPLYLHYVPAEEIGVMAAVMAAAALVGVVANLKLDSAMRAFYFDHHEDSEATTSLLRQVFSASIITASLVYLVLLPLGGPIFALVFAHDTVTYFPAGALAVGTAALNACLATYFVYLRNRLLLAELARWQMGILAATACLQATLLIGFDLGVNGILWGALCPVAMALLLLVIIRPGLLSARLDAKMVGPCLRFSLPLVGLGVIYALGTRFDRLLLERHVALAELGAYAVLMSLFALVRIVLTILDDACRPYLYPALKAGDLAHERFQRLYFLVGLAAVSTVVFAGAYLNLLTEDP
ncbi:MAG TPA: oligosaccharide flippase family protein, partial [Gammaproteobacteria bacterium]|nr:oligosaccharide flippase family protein [Gammaproteobacteria bacterium]